jgi:hypothetical protein
MNMLRDRNRRLTLNLLIGLLGLSALFGGIFSHTWWNILSGALITGAVIGTFVLQSRRKNGQGKL